MDIDIKNILKIARIHLSQEEVSRIENDFKKILNYFDVLSEIKTENIPPLYHALESVKNAFKDDEVLSLNSEDRERILSQAPMREKNYFKTRPVFKNNK